MLSSTAALHVHPAVKPLSYLLGTWRGQGEGCFPTIASFKYGEEIQFSNLDNKPVIAYSSKTWKLSSGEPMHAESGYWRPKPDGTVEVVLAQSTGLVEVQKGTHNAEEKVVKLQSELVGNASKVREITRVFNLVNGELAYVVEMATNQTSLQKHLKASLKKL
ncbi:peroxynitrite isomerase Rv2717c isoform X2 [Diospyros lotus]|uniref:peroxynitrite isomerase Rv2717c isoform X2 n=1 Tax=Diospyros lotus TaxID=55363 RepID=UPI002252EAE9|nr:peroxynitrite isomerase Rv2717c isoform X2 [Diospyros lotus]